MSYEPTTWKDGDLVTSAKLNKLEQGIANGGGILIVHADENGVLDKTWQEIYDADVCIICIFEDSDKFFNFVTGVISPDPLSLSHQNYTITTQTDAIYTASSQDDYPVYDEESSGGGLR